MHYYQFNIGDYRRDTVHLSPTEHYIYRTLIDMYYLGEMSILDDIPKILRILGLPNDCSTTVQQVFNDFFVLFNGRWTHKRIDDEIARYHNQIEAASKAGKASAAARKANKQAVRERPFNDRSTNQEPITNNQEPITSIKYMPPINGELLADWLEVRKAKRAGRLTETAFRGLQREARLAGISDEQAVKICCERGWQSFKAEWLVKDRPGQAAGVNGRPWYHSASGIEAKGKEFGLELGQGAFPSFRDQVYKMAGVTPEMLKVDK